ncbi:MAG: HAMP domain-containing histidine kinase [Candidatus Obscuribacterales bacterium]|nr:HAMP domain-containing histidine kinase [Steroidobacteraceae bacterium]
MLHEFLSNNRPELIERCKVKVATRPAGAVVRPEAGHGIPLLIDQLIKTLQAELTSEPVHNPGGPTPRPGDTPVKTEIGATAKLHGHDLLQQGFTVDQVVHGYGDLCQAVTELAFESESPIQVEEFRTLNRCLDDAIAGAVTEYSSRRESWLKDQNARALNERLGLLAHELRNLIHTATLAVTAIKVGNVGLKGATGAVLDRSLVALRNLIDRSLADVRITAGLPTSYQVISVADFVAEIYVSAALEAEARGCSFTVGIVDKKLTLLADRDMLFSAVGNLLQNAFKFTHRGTVVSLNVRVNADRVLIEVEDGCGGLQPGIAEKMFLPFTQHGTDRSGLGLGLSICRRSVEANKGMLTVRDVPGTGCVFTVDLPRHLPI